MGLFDHFARSIGLKNEENITFEECKRLYNNENYNRAFEYCLKFTMENEDPHVWTMLGNMYKKGLGCAVNKVEAFNWMLKAANAGVAEAEYQIGKMYEVGFGTNKDPTEALMWVTKSANHYYPDAAYELSDLYSSGERLKYDKNKAFAYCYIAANAGHPQAQCALGLFFYNESRSAANYYQAINWFKKAAEQGVTEANYNLAQAYLQNRFPGRNLDEYIKNLTIAANDGIDAAVMELGCAYFDGVGVARNYEKAIEYLKNPLLADNVEALKKLAYMYEMGLGTKSDSETAYVLYQKAAGLGSSFAKYKLGSFMYSAGNKEEAFRWYQESANHTFPLAQARLAEMYYLGDGVAVDHKQSYHYAYFAAKLGVNGFSINIDKYKMGLNDLEISTIENEVDMLLSPIDEEQ